MLVYMTGRHGREWIGPNIGALHDAVVNHYLEQISKGGEYGQV